MEQEKIKLHEPFRVICIDDKNKPPQVDDDEWVVEKEEYIVTDVFKDLLSGKFSYKILDKNPEPFKGYVSDRFGVISNHSVN